MCMARTLVDSRCGLKFAASPRWFDRQLTFLDSHDRSIKAVDAGGSVSVVASLPFLPGALGISNERKVFVADAPNRHLYELRSGRLRHVADVSELARFWINDGVCDVHGGMYLVDVGYQHLDPLSNPVPNGTIIYVNSSGIPLVVADGLYLPCGLLISADDRTLMVAESIAHRLTAFDIRKNGTLCRRRCWARLGDDVRPNGICQDDHGAVWTGGCGRRALRIQEGGEVLEQVATRFPVFATLLAGPERSQLFMCTASSNDPVATRLGSDATIDVVDVTCPGSGIP